MPVASTVYKIHTVPGEIKLPKAGDVVYFHSTGKEYLAKPSNNVCEGCNLLNLANGDCKLGYYAEKENTCAALDCISYDVIFEEIAQPVAPIPESSKSTPTIPGYEHDYLAAEYAKQDKQEARIKLLKQAQALGAVVMVETNQGWKEHNINVWSIYCNYKLREEQHPDILLNLYDRFGITEVKELF